MIHSIKCLKHVVSEIRKLQIAVINFGNLSVALRVQQYSLSRHGSHLILILLVQSKSLESALLLTVSVKCKKLNHPYIRHSGQENFVLRRLQSQKRLARTFRMYSVYSWIRQMFQMHLGCRWVVATMARTCGDDDDDDDDADDAQSGTFWMRLCCPFHNHHCASA